MSPLLRSARTLVVLFCAAAGLLLSGCAAPIPQPPAVERFSLEKADEQLRLARSGRFILSVQHPQWDQRRGGQGRFEWLQLTPATAMPSNQVERQLLIWLGPLGQTLGSLERRLIASPAGLLKEKRIEAVIHVFDAQGRPLDVQQHSWITRALLGDTVTALDEVELRLLMRSLMDSFESLATLASGGREFEFSIRQLDIRLRAVLDPI